MPVGVQGVQAWDRYAYVNNNPARFNDPSGHFINLTTAAVGAAVGFTVDFAFQVGPQLWAGKSISQLEYNLAQGVGAAVGGAIAGATFGIGLALAPSAGVGTMAFAGAAGNVLGNQTSALVQASLVTSAPIFSSEAQLAASQYGFGDPGKMALDGAVGAITGGGTHYLSHLKAVSRAPKGFQSTIVLTEKGSVPVFRPVTVTNRLGNPITKPDFRAKPSGQTGFWKGITDTGNYAAEAISKAVSEWY